jgi:hypothetical protein
LQNIVQANMAVGQNGAQPGLVIQLKDLVLGRLTHIGIYQDHTFAGLGQSGGQVGRNQAFALLRVGTGEQHCSRRASPVTGLEIRA